MIGARMAVIINMVIIINPITDVLLFNSRNKASIQRLFDFACFVSCVCISGVEIGCSDNACTSFLMTSIKGKLVYSNFILGSKYLYKISVIRLTNTKIIAMIKIVL